MIVLKVEVVLIKGHQVVFERCFENTTEGQIVNYFSNELPLASRLIQFSKQRIEGKLCCFSAFPYSRVFTCLSNLIGEVKVFTIVFSSYDVCDLNYYCYWLKLNLWINDQ